METRKAFLDLIKELEKKRNNAKSYKDKLKLSVELRTAHMLGLNSLFGATTLPKESIMYSNTNRKSLLTKEYDYAVTTFVCETVVDGKVYYKSVKSGILYDISKLEKLEGTTIPIVAFRDRETPDVYLLKEIKRSFHNPNPYLTVNKRFEFIGEFHIKSVMVLDNILVVKGKVATVRGLRRLYKVKCLDLRFIGLVSNKSFPKHGVVKIMENIIAFYPADICRESKGLKLELLYSGKIKNKRTYNYFLYQDLPRDKRK